MVPQKWLQTVVLALALSHALAVRGGGSGLNTVVVINQASSNSCEVGNYFCERRQVPPDNVIYISWTGDNTSWTNDDFQTNLLTPLLDALEDRQLTNQVDYVVLSMDIPYQTVYDSVVNSTTAALFYGLKPDGGTNWLGVTNSYAASEAAFDQARPASAPSYSFLATMLTDESASQAEQVVDQGVGGDGTFPQYPVILAESSDTSRNVRYPEFDNAVFNADVRGSLTLVRTNSDSAWGLTNLLGYETGLADFSCSSNTFVPGAMADNLTSFGGVLFVDNSQTTLLEFLHAGAAGSYGTVTEPYADTQKFPDPQNYFYQARGFSLAECYYQSLVDPYEGLIVGEPLSAPFARPGWGKWVGVASNAVLQGTASLSLRFAAADALHPLQQIDLFVDGHYFETLTNLGPAPGNVLSMTLNGYPVTYAVPTNATLGGVAAGLTALLNTPAISNATGLAAFAHGDRVELQCLASNQLSIPFYFTDLTATNGVAPFYRATYLPAPLPPQLSSSGLDQNGAFRLHVGLVDAMSIVVQASTDLKTWVGIVTNLSGSSLDLLDTAAPRYPRRFYRVVGTVVDPRPVLTISANGGGSYSLRAQSAGTEAYDLEVSSDLVAWSSLTTNLAGGTIDFTDTPSPGLACRFYRARLLGQPPAPAQMTVVGASGAGGTLVEVSGAARPYIIQSSTDQVHWTSLVTNLVSGQVLAAGGSSAGGGGILTTFLTPSRSAFLNSPADGLQSLSANGIFQVGTWLQLSVLKTNGVTVTLAVTNQSSTNAMLDLATQLASQVNAEPSLQGSDGVQAQDLDASLYGGAVFNLTARSPGRDAAAIQAQFSGVKPLVISPKLQTNLTANLSNLQPRNHFYVTAGASSLALTFPLDTTLLADGSHELTAVAYEGSSVRTQTSVTLPVRITNSPWAASLALLDLGATAPVQGTYHIQVAANTNTVGVIKLFSTGGLLAASTNQPAVTFAVEGPTLGVGLHPFYATVQTTSGHSFRTATQWVRLVH